MGILQRIDARLTRLAIEGYTPSRSVTYPTGLTVQSYEQFLAGLNGGMGLRQTISSALEDIAPGYLGHAQSAYAGNPIVFACMQARFSLFAEARFQFRQIRSGRPGDLFGTAALRRLESPWTGGTTGDLLSRMQVSADLGGNAFVVVTKTGGLRVVRPDWVTMVLGSESAPATRPEDVEAELIAILYHPGGKHTGATPEVYLRGEFAHYAPIPDPLAPFRGMSWLTPVLREVQGDSGYSTHKLKFLENGATVNLIVTVGGALNDKQFGDWVKAFEASHKGAANAFKTLYLTAGTEAKPVGSNFTEMDFKAVQGAGETRIAAAAGVPPVVAGFSEGLQGSSLNEGNYTAARRRFADLTMRPLWRNAAGSLSVLIDVPSGSELWYDDRDISFLQEDVADAAAIQEKEALTIRQLVDAGFEPDGVVDAVTAGDLKRLKGKHTGLYSVQLQDPLAPTPEPVAPVAPPEPGRSLEEVLLRHLPVESRDEERTAQLEAMRSFGRMLSDLGDLFRDRSAPVVNVAAPEVRVEFSAPEVNVPATIVNLPEMVVHTGEPIINVQTTPEVRVEVQQAAAPEVRVEVMPAEVHLPAPEIRVDVQPATVMVPAPEVRVEAPNVTVTPTISPVVSVEFPAEQTVHIASLPPLKARVKRDRQGRVESIEE